MAGGEDTRNHPNRKVTKEALGKRYAEIGVGFGDNLANGDEVLDRAIQNLMPSPFENTDEDAEEEQRQAFAETHEQIRRNMSEGKYMGEMED